MSKLDSGLFPINRLDNNIHYLSKEYVLNSNGYFGKKGSRGGIREIYSSDPILEATKFFDIISEGGTLSVMKNGHGILATMPDETIISFRIKTSSKNSPAVEINVKGDHPKLKRYQKIHFIKQ